MKMKMKKTLALIVSSCIMASTLIPVGIVSAESATVDLDYQVRSNNTAFTSLPYFGPADYVRTDELGTISIKAPSAGGTVAMGYHGASYLDENLKITAKFGGTFSGMSQYVWDAFYLRSQGNGSNLPVGYWTLDKYMFTVSNTRTINLYRMNNKELTYLTGATASETVDLTTENVYEFAAVNSAESVDLTLKINGTSLILYSDTSASRITTAGYFGVASSENDSTIEIGKKSAVADLNLQVRSNKASFTSPWPYFVPENYIRTDGNDTISIQSSILNGGIQMGYNASTYLNEALKFSAKFGGGFSTGASWDAFYLRSKDDGANPPVGGYSKDKYMFTIPASKNIQLYRMNAGTLTYIAPSTVPGDVDLTAENEYEMCATNYPDSVYVTLKINGITVIDYNDTSADRIQTAGYFGVADFGNNSIITLGKTSTTINMDLLANTNNASFESPLPYFNPTDYIKTIENGSISIKSSTLNGGINMGYSAASYLDENLKFTAKFSSEFNSGISWNAFYLRSKDNGYNPPVGVWSKDKYMIIIPPSKNIQLYRMNGGALNYIAPSTVPGSYDPTVENVYEMSATNYPGSVYVTFRINGVTVISYNDTSADRIQTSGYFGVSENGNNSTITIGRKPVTFTNYNTSPEYKITNLQLGTTVNNFFTRGVANYDSETTFAFKASDNTPISGGNPVGTGTKVDITAPNGTFEYTVIVYGDIDGNGTISVDDLALIKQHILNIQTLSGDKLIAGNASKHTTGTVSISDLLAVKKQIIGTAAISQS